MTAPYQLFDALDPATEAALKASIRRFGVIVPVVMDQRGRIIDGHHRKRIADELGLRCEIRTRRVRSDDEALELARTLNEDRRHLDRDQRRQVVGDLAAAGHSVRAIAGAVGAPKSTVQDDIAQLSESGQLERPATSMGLDGKERPATRPAATAEPDEDPLFADGEMDAIIDTLREEHGHELTAEQIEQAIEDNVETKRVPDPVEEWTPAKPDVGGGVSHPARFSDALIPVFADLLRDYSPGHLVLDPFAGTGRIHELRPDWETWGVELEPEWADLSEWTRLGSALELPWPTGEFDAVVTSPTYGNRLADHHNASDPERRRSYTHDLGRDLHPDNTGAMQWGDDYRHMHTAAWMEAARVLKSGGVFLLNIKDHIRAGERQHVAGWHITALTRLGLTLLCHQEVGTPSLRQGENSHIRLTEQIYVLRKDG